VAGLVGLAAQRGPLPTAAASIKPQVMHAAQAPAPPSPAAQTPSAPATVSAERALVNRYCITCHNERRPTPAGAPLLLDKLNIDDVSQDPAIWEKVVRKVRSGAMPPPNLPRPDAATFATWVHSLEGALDRAAARKPDVGRPARVHRLNRAEYTNAVRDLLAVEIDGRSMLPTDDSGYGFDNIGDVLSVSPGLLERYLLAAAKISRQAIGDPSLKPGTTTYRMSPLLLQTDRLGEDLPFGSRGGIAVRHNFPLDGEYVIKVDLSRQLDGAQIRGTHDMEVRLDRELVQKMTIDASKAGMGSGKNLPEVRVPVKAGMRLVTVSFAGAADQFLPRDARPSPPPPSSFAYQLNPIDAAVNNIQVIGPYDGKVPQTTESRKRIFVCQPAAAKEETACATRILGTLARRAYRRPVTEADTKPLLGAYQAGRAKGDFESGIMWGVEAILVSPKFLFRVEQDPAGTAPGTAYRLDDLALASRLSFFLWSSIPDDELIDVASRGQLKDAGTLERQVKRMMADPKASAFITNFAGQWLYLRNLRTHSPNADLFFEFDDNLREGFQRETELFVQDQLQADRSVIDLLTADYTFINERLARHYEIPNVYGSHFRRVQYPDARRAGLLGQGSLLMVTSYPNRTSPVKRGQWLLENLLGSPPPPPPPNIPALRENGEGEPPTTVRARLEAHRRNPVCASCHGQMDPLGFALENFDAVGKWREIDAEAKDPIDSSGTLADGTKFSGPVEFRTVLLSKRRDDFVANLTEKLMTYALGRGVEYFDMPVVRQIVNEAETKDYKWSSLILGVVNSKPFQMRMSAQPAAGQSAANAVRESSSGRRAQ
jgi:mono/diheme cytochrome c family protein